MQVDIESSDITAREASVRRSVPVMRTFPTIVAVIGVLLLAFGFWGTHMGAARFGDGFIPIAASAAGGLLLIAGVVADLVAERKHRKAAR